jgi:hypothetical protein
VTTKAELLEQCAEAAHNAWMAEKMRRGVTTWPNELGDEQLRPYDELAESVKEFDRIVIGGITCACSVGRTDAYGTGRGQWIKREPTPAVYAPGEHLRGEGPGLGIAPLLDDGTVWFAAIDLDEPDFDAAREMQEFLSSVRRGSSARAAATRTSGRSSSTRSRHGSRAASCARRRPPSASRPSRCSRSRTSYGRAW